VRLEGLDEFKNPMKSSGIAGIEPAILRLRTAKYALIQNTCHPWGNSKILLKVGIHLAAKYVFFSSKLCCFNKT
jgi:hypothetical protein